MQLVRHAAHRITDMFYEDEWIVLAEVSIKERVAKLHQDQACCQNASTFCARLL